MERYPVFREYQLIQDPGVVRAVGVILLATLASLLSVSGFTLALHWRLVPLLCLLSAGCTGLALLLCRSGRVRAAVLLTLVAVGYSVMHTSVKGDGMQSIGLVTTPVLIVMASLLLGGRMSMLYCAAAILATATMLAIRYSVLRLESYSKNDLGDFFIFAVICVTTAVLGRLLSTRIQDGIRQIRASEVRYRRIFENVQDVYCEMRPDGTLLELNPAAAQVFGIPRESMIDRALGAFCADAAEFDTLVAEVAARRSVANRELIVRHASGEDVPVLVNATIQDADSEGGERIIASLHDIAEWRRTEEALRSSETRVRLAADAIGVGTFDFYPQSEKLIWSDVTKAQFGFTPGTEVDHATFLRAVHPDDRERIRRAQAAASAPDGNGQLATEYRTIRARDGKERWIAVRGCMFFDREQRPTRLIGLTLDITERKQTEAALREAAETARRRAEELATLMDLVPAAILVSQDPECRSIIGNRAADENYESIAGSNVSAGTTTGEAVNTERRFFIGDRELQPHELAMQRAATTGKEIRDFECDVLLPSGRRRTLLANATPLRDNLGRVRGCIGAHLDITGRKRLEEELRRRAEEWQTIMDVAPVAIFVAQDPECRSITLNRTAQSLIEADCAAAAAAGGTAAVPNLRFLRDGVEIPAGKLPLAIAATGVDVRDYEMQAVLPGGAAKWLWGHASPLRDAAGRIRGAVAAFQDVTAARQRAENRLRESEERFRNTADAAPVIIWLGDAEGRMIWINREAGRFSGEPMEAHLQGGCGALVHPGDREALQSVRRRAISERSAYQIEYRARRADGEYRDMLSTAVPRYVGADYAGYAGSIVDITDLKRRQVVDATRQKWQSLGTLAGGIAHDFNNLLGGILAQSELALGELAAGGSPYRELKTIGEVARTGAEIVRQLMIYAGKETKAGAGADVSAIVGSMLDLLKVSVSKHAALETDLTPDLPGVRADAAQVRQVVMNLVTNASDAIGDRDGVIRITTSRAAIGPLDEAADGLAPGDYVRLEVSDTGCGMSQQTQAHVFDPFFTTKSAGHGLGLAVVHGIVRAAGGAVRISSEPGRGTAFHVFLPCVGVAAGAADEATAVGKESTPLPREAAVLLVEDEEPIRQAVGKILRKRGFEVLEAETGSVALDLLRDAGRQIDVMLLDMTIPGASSREVAAEAARLRPSVPVVLTSAYSEEMVDTSAGAPQIRGFIRKPFRVQELIETLRSALAS